MIVMDKMVVCPKCNATVVNSNFCPQCGQPLQSSGKSKVDDGLVNLVKGITSLVQGTSKLVSALGEVVENRASEGVISKDVDKVLVSLGDAIRNMGDTVDRFSNEVAEKAEKEIRKNK
jgi:hypothetical protein